MFCFRCGNELTGAICGKCGFDLRNRDINLLFELNSQDLKVLNKLLENRGFLYAIEDSGQERISFLKKIISQMSILSNVLDEFPEDMRQDVFYNGLKMTFDHFCQLAEKTGVELIKSVGQKFDHNIHDAKGMERSMKYSSGVVIKEICMGFRYKGILVPAQVIVSR